MKFVPKLYFKLDKSMEESEHINELLKEIKDDLV
jgi:ribosome-binding factor A